MTNRITVPQKPTIELSYLYGVLLGDGCITVRPDKKEWTIYCGGNRLDEKEFYQGTIKPLMNTVFGVTVKLKEKNDGTYGFGFGSKELALYFVLKLNFPLGKKYTQMYIPNFVLINEEFLKAFIRGLFDTDGSISFKKRHKQAPYYPVISFCSKNTFFVEQIASLLQLLGFKPSVHERFNVDERFAGGGNHICQLALYGYDNFELWQRGIGFWNPKHNEKIARVRFELTSSGL